MFTWCSTDLCNPSNQTQKPYRPLCVLMCIKSTFSFSMPAACYESDYEFRCPENGSKSKAIFTSCFITALHELLRRLSLYYLFSNLLLQHCCLSFPTIGRSSSPTPVQCRYTRRLSSLKWWFRGWHGGRCRGWRNRGASNEYCCLEYYWWPLRWYVWKHMKLGLYR